MNLLHLKYAAQVADMGSIRKAADALYMGQPNLSRAIKELEENLGIVIFNRTSKGVVLTPQGEEFLVYARAILAQVDDMEALYSHSADNRLKFTLSAPRASYISQAFVNLIKSLDKSKDIEANFKETNAMRTIKNVVTGDFNLGIIRYQSVFDRYFSMLLNEKDLASKLIREFRFYVIMSREHPLAQEPVVSMRDLSSYIELVHGDPYVPFMPLAEVKKAELTESVKKRILVYERGSQYDMLSGVPGTYMWVSPIPRESLECHNLVLKPCADSDRCHRDVMIYKKSYHWGNLDKRFMQELEAVLKDCDGVEV